MPEELRHEIEREAGEPCVRVSGDLDMNGTLRLEGVLDDLLDEAPERILIDLSGASFVDSTGMNLLFSFERDARSRGIAVELVPGPPEVMRVFETTGLASVLPFRAGT